MSNLHESTFEYLAPTDEQREKMGRLRAAAKVYAGVLDTELADGPDKQNVLWQIRDVAMWANNVVTRQIDGTPRIASTVQPQPGVTTQSRPVSTVVTTSAGVDGETVEQPEADVEGPIAGQPE